MAYKVKNFPGGKENSLILSRASSVSANSQLQGQFVRELLMSLAGFSSGVFVFLEEVLALAGICLQHQQSAILPGLASSSTQCPLTLFLVTCFLFSLFLPRLWQLSDL